jgi:hypothetical protein
MAIIKPEQMNFSDKKFSMIIAGSPGIGKTTLAFSAPNPILLDFDKGVSRVSAKHRKMTAIVESYDELLQDLNSLEVQQSETLIIDTGGSFITFLQDWAVKRDPRMARNKLQMFGVVKQEFTNFTNRMQYAMNKNIIYIFHTVEEKDNKGGVIQRLLCEGSARNLVWQPCDLGAYMFINPNGRFLGFTPTDEYFAKGCYGINGIIPVPTLTGNTENNFLSTLIDTARNTLKSESAMYAEEKAIYEKAMETIKNIISEISNAETANANMENFKNIQHSLTSKNECAVIWKRHMSELGVNFDKEQKCYV